MACIGLAILIAGCRDSSSEGRQELRDRTEQLIAQSECILAQHEEARPLQQQIQRLLEAGDHESDEFSELVRQLNQLQQEQEDCS